MASDLDEPTTAHVSAPEPLQSPLHDRHQALGAKWADFGGWSMPLEYTGGGVTREHMAVRTGVGVFDVSHLGTARIVGPGAVAAADAVLTNSLERLTRGQAQYTLLCNDAGGVIDDLIVYRISDGELLLIPNAANSVEVLDVLRAALPSPITITDLHRRIAIIAVQGPRSAEVLDAVGLPTAMDYMAFEASVLDEVDVTVCRTGYTGERGYELLIEADHAGVLWDALLAVDVDGGVVACGLAARDTLRTEMGYPLHGQDLSPTITPVQARIGWAVGWSKPAFHGRDALMAERDAGPARRLLGLRAIARGIPRTGMSVVSSTGERVGEVTSGTFSPTLQQGIALALLDAGVEVGDVVEVDVRGRALSCEVVKPPFVQASTR